MEEFPRCVDVTADEARYGNRWQLFGVSSHLVDGDELKVWGMWYVHWVSMM